MAPPTAAASISPLPPLHPDLCQRAWASVPHPTLPLLATPHATSVAVFSLATLSKHSVLTGGHARSVRAATWQPGLAPGKLRLATGSFDATAGLWSWDSGMEREEWEFNLVLEGHENEVKGVAFSPSGQYLATCSRDKSVWIWEDVGVAGGEEEGDDGGEWETVAVLNEHEGDVKAIAWCPDVPGRTGHGRSSADVLASASYDNTVRTWREDSDGEWVCVSVLAGHDATVWGLQWEPKPKDDKTFPRLLTFSADATIRVWTLRQDDEDEEAEKQEASSNAFRPAWGGIPNTMRRELREEWDCTAILPKAHTREVYSATWSADSGLVASAGSDGIIALYGEGSPDGDIGMASSTDPGTNGWRLLATVADGHGPYEINHITWCKRFDAGTERKGEEEMLITTGDDGVIRPWQVRTS
ncbi:WD repeat domain-containing protein [Lasiosphaeris hirsuta]|uniref:Probable cytosolic iron-sulfur protein assembly protein 1 n=1 Tax=Lasiosphaeris hirsuta TaxID=260670 RepID=A0AA39ZWX9_9PEZI|nr:WD repeat domain-containing protein [Lasiosphaeris hirsuta]